jgi:hypothetical protein
VSGLFFGRCFLDLRLIGFAADSKTAVNHSAKPAFCSATPKGLIQGVAIQSFANCNDNLRRFKESPTTERT